MAIYEDEGYCPSFSFARAFCSRRDGMEDVVMPLIVAQIGRMVYDNKKFRRPQGDEECSIVDATICNKNPLLGVQIACHLHVINPEPALSCRKILIRDTFNIWEYYNIGYWEYEGREGFSFYVDGIILAGQPKVVKDSAFLYFDDRYLVVVDNNKGRGDIVITLQRRF